MRRSSLAFCASIGLLVILVTTDATAAAQARLHGSGLTWTSDEVQVRTESSDVTPKRGDQRWWVWMLVGGGVALVGGTLWIAALGRRGIPMRFTQPVSTARVSVVLKTVPMQPAGGKTPPISPVVSDARGTVHLLPPTGLAAWLVVYRDGMPCETLVLQTIGVTTIGREGLTSICLEDSAVSKRHATIMAVGGRFVLEDSKDPKPQNPTQVDGKLLDGPIELRDNMWLQIGSTRLRFKCTA